MDFYVCGINTRSESSLISSDLLLCNKGVPESSKELVYCVKSKYDIMRILSEFVYLYYKPRNP